MPRPRLSRLACLLTALAIGVAAVLTACSGDEPEGPADEVTIVLQWVVQAQFAGYYVALEKGFYEDEHLNVEIQPGGPDIMPVQQVAAGAADLAVQPFSALLSARDQGIDVVAVAQVFERSGYRLVSWADDGVESPADWRGKKIGVWAGQEPVLLEPVLATLSKYGITQGEDVELVDQGFDMQLLLTRQVDLASAMIYNEFAQLIQAGNPVNQFRLFDFGDHDTNMLEDALIANGGWLADEDNQDAVVRFLRASAKGWAVCADDPEECVEIVLRYGPALPRAHQTWMMNEVNKLIWPSSKGWGVIDRDSAARTADILLRYEVISGAADLDAAYTNEYVEAALEDFSDDDRFRNDYEPLELDVEDLLPDGR